MDVPVLGRALVHTRPRAQVRADGLLLGGLLTSGRSRTTRLESSAFRQDDPCYCGNVRVGYRHCVPICVQHGGMGGIFSDWTVMDTYPHEAWQRLGRALERRRGELGYGFRQRGRFSRERGGGRISIKTISRLEKGERSSYPQSTVGAVETIYRWAPGSVEAVLRGGDPDPLAVTPAPPAAAAATPSPPSTPRPRPASGSPAGCTCACANWAATKTTSTSSSPPRACPASRRPCRPSSGSWRSPGPASPKSSRCSESTT